MEFLIMVNIFKILLFEQGIDYQDRFLKSKSINPLDILLLD